MKIDDLRTEYMRASLDESSVAPEPLRQFEQWFTEAVNAQMREPNAMTLATVGADGRPSARVVLLKAADARGFTFYTNYSSRKARELAAHPYAALLFYWPELERQIRIEGTARAVSATESDAYFVVRPRASRIGAWASPQSSPIPDREWLEAAFAAASARFAADVPRPPNWGGLRVEPDHFEFWQGRESRLHDRLAWSRAGDGWTLRRLAP